MTYCSKECSRNDGSVGGGSHVYAPDTVHLLAKQHVTPEHQSLPVLFGDAAHVALQQDQVALCVGLKICVLIDLGKSRAPADLDVACNFLEIVVLLSGAGAILKHRHRLDEVGNCNLIPGHGDIYRCGRSAVAGFFDEKRCARGRVFERVNNNLRLLVIGRPAATIQRICTYCFDQSSDNLAIDHGKTPTGAFGRHLCDDLELSVFGDLEHQDPSSCAA